MSAGQDDYLAPQRYVDWINANIGFNPRGQQHSNELSKYMLDDLVRKSSALSADLASERVVAEYNKRVEAPHSGRNVDFVIRDNEAPGPLDSIRIAIEHKTLMTAHGKARLNRQGDIIAAATHNHNHGKSTIVGATMIVNMSQLYRNPDAFAREIIRTQISEEKWTAYIADTLACFTGLSMRSDIQGEKDEPEAVAIILVHYDGENPARLVMAPPAPQPGEQGHIGVLYQRILHFYEERFREGDLLPPNRPHQRRKWWQRLVKSSNVLIV
jgi:hypothetical protein